MAIERFDDFVNVSTPIDAMDIVNTNTDGAFGLVIIAALFVVSFLGVRTSENKERFVVGSLFAFIASSFFAAMGILNPMYITITAVAVIASVAWLYFERRMV